MEHKARLLLVLKPSKTVFFFSFIFLICWTVVSVFGVIIPVLSTGNFNAVWMAHLSTNKNMEIFLIVLAWIPLLPSGIPLKNIGNFYFYDDRMEVVPFLGWKKRVFPYEEMLVTIMGTSRVTITQRNLPGWTQPWQRYKAEYWNGMSFGQRYSRDDTYEMNVQNAVEILQQRAGELWLMPDSRLSI